MKKLFALSLALCSSLISAMNQQITLQPHQIVDVLEITKKAYSTSLSYIPAASQHVPCIGSYFNPIFSDRASTYEDGMSMVEQEYTVIDTYKQLNFPQANFLHIDGNEYFKVRLAIALLHDSQSTCNTCIVVTNKSPEKLQSFLEGYIKELNSLQSEPSSIMKTDISFAAITSQIIPKNQLNNHPHMLSQVLSDIFSAHPNRKKIFFLHAHPTSQQKRKPKEAPNPQPAIQQPQPKTKHSLLGNIKAYITNLSRRTVALLTIGTVSVSTIGLVFLYLSQQK